MRQLALVAALVAACGGKPPQPATPPGPSPAASRDAGVSEPDTPTDGALTDAQCAAMADHMIDVNLAARRAQGVDHVPPEDEITAIREQTRAELVPTCVEAFSRAVYDCWMKADSLSALEACAAGATSPE